MTEETEPTNGSPSATLPRPKTGPESRLPISGVRVADSVDLDLTGLTVIVGPNSSGKTQLLRDINAAICGQQLAVATKISYRVQSGFDEYVNDCAASGDLELRHQGSQVTWRKMRHQFGVNDGAGSEQAPSSLEQQYLTFVERSSRPATGELVADPFLQFVGGLSCSSLFLDTRLTLLLDVNNFDYQTTPASNLVQALYLDGQARKLLEQETVRIFGRPVWVDFTRANILMLRASDQPGRPTVEDRLQPAEMPKYRPLSSEGDGLRSYVAVCATLLLSQRPLCLIDEPELCLHPPQAYAMGRFIGNHAKRPGRGTLVATHSSHVLRGILEAAASIPVVRLIRSGGSFAAHSVDAEVLASAIRNPRARAEAALDGLFSEGVVLCEAEGDRVVYDAAMRKLEQQTSRDVRFVATSGLMGFAELIRLYRALRVPCSVVADFDVLTNETGLLSIAEAIELSEVLRTRMTALSRAIVNHLKAQPSTFSKDDVVAQLESICARELDWSQGDDVKLREELKKIGDGLSRLRSIRGSGMRALPSAMATEAGEVLQMLAEAGIFIVPVGALESWMPTLMADVGKSDKARWANEAAVRIPAVLPGQVDDVCGFVARIDRWLAGRILAAPPPDGSIAKAPGVA